MKKTLSAILFFLIFAFDIFAVTVEDRSMELWTKPLLIPSLVIYLFSSAAGSRKLLFFALAALVLSWAGDCILLADRVIGGYFVYGLVAFLAAHILYVAHFLKLRKAAGIQSRPSIVFFVLVVLYAVGLLYSLRPHLGGMMYPVVIYGAVISVMFASSLGAIPKGGARYANAGAVGALLFLASDSLLAINRFAAPIDFAATLTMLTYGLAQFLIAEGAASATREIAE